MEVAVDFGSESSLWELGPLGAEWVSGTAEFADPAQLTALFVPSSPLKASTEYLLIVSGESHRLVALGLQAALRHEAQAVGRAPIHRGG